MKYLGHTPNVSTDLSTFGQISNLPQTSIVDNGNGTVTVTTASGGQSANEISYAENSSGTTTSVSGNLNYVAVPGCTIVVPITTSPYAIDWQASIAVTTSGGGSIYAVLQDTSALPSGSTVNLSSVFCGVVPTNSGAGSANIQTLRGRQRFFPTSTVKVYQLALAQFLDSGSALVSQSLNTTFQPSFITAVFI